MKHRNQGMGSRRAWNEPVGSIDDMIAGLSSWSITTLSATFENVAVSEIGRRFLL